jgi:chromosome partitioning protein
MFSFSRNHEQTHTNSGKIIAFMNQKGGVGKTSMAFNVAEALHKKNKKVLCIDLDPQANLSLLMGQNSSTTQNSIFNLLINSIKELKNIHSPVLLSQVLKRMNKEPIMDLLPSAQNLSGFELTVAGINSPRQLILKKFIEKNELTKIYDYIIIDAPPTLGLIVVNIICAAHGIIYPFIPDHFSEQGLKNIKDVVNDVSEMGISETPKTIGYIPNLFESRRKQAQVDLERMKLEFNEGVMFEPFYNKAPMARAMAQNKSVFSYDSQEYTDLKEQFLKVADLVEESFNEK